MNLGASCGAKSGRADVGHRPVDQFHHVHPEGMRATVGAVIGALTLVLAGCAGGHTSSAERGEDLGELLDEDVRRDLEVLRAATTGFHDIAQAWAAGYPTTMPKCIADSTMGGMGYHLVDRTHFDDKLDIERPEMLIYAPATEGKVELVAVEYVVPYRAVPSTANPPRLFGQDLKRYDQLNYWALHVWAWRRNPAGLFADWNPTVRC